MTKDDLNQAEWRNPANWSGGLLGVYSSPVDTRVWVPKRTPALGWTLNFAHSASRWWLLGLIAVPLLFTALIAVLVSK
jgi:uncharacterized membrane protein